MEASRTSLTASGFNAVGLTSLQQKWPHIPAIYVLVFFASKGYYRKTKRMTA